MNAILLAGLLAAQARVVINEVMANPAAGSGAHYPEDRNEFVELYNTTDDTIDLRGWRLMDFDAGGSDTLCAWTDTMIQQKYPHVRTHSCLVYPHSFALVMDPEYTDSAPKGGFIQPYHLTDRLLLLRPGNTTIGSGLSNTDPLLLCSPNGTDTSTFGTPFDEADSIPRDAGDGVSWERIRPDAPDDDTCWYRSVDSGGCTPGRANSITTYQNLICRELLCFPLSYRSGMTETIVVKVRNTGRVPVEAWSVRVYRDANGNGREDGLEHITRLTGPSLDPALDSILVAQWPDPEPGVHTIVAELECPGDQNPDDNRATTTLNLAASQQSFMLSATRFGPNLHTGPETLAISFCLADDKGNLLLTVHDLAGRQRAVIFQGHPTAKYGLITWDGRDKTGNLLPTGLYVITFEYKSGKQSICEKKTVVLAKGR